MGGVQWDRMTPSGCALGGQGRVGRPPVHTRTTTPRRSRHTTSLLGASAAVRAGPSGMNREAGEFGHRTRFRMLPPTPPATYVADLARSLGLRRA